MVTVLSKVVTMGGRDVALVGCVDAVQCSHCKTCSLEVSVLARAVRLLGLQIGSEGAHCLAEVLRTNRVLEHLSLNNCNIGDDGVQPITNGKCSHTFTHTC